MQKISDRLLLLRKNLGLSQKEVAKGMELSISSYQRYEYGFREPTSGTIIKFAEFFNVSADYLLGLSDESARR